VGQKLPTETDQDEVIRSGWWARRRPSLCRLGANGLFRPAEEKDISPVPLGARAAGGGLSLISTPRRVAARRIPDSQR